MTSTRPQANGTQIADMLKFQGTAAQYTAQLARASGYDGPWPQNRDRKPSRVVVSIAHRYPLRATLPVAPLGTLRKAVKAVGDRLAISAASDPDYMWIWARTQEDAAAATTAMPALEFVEHDGTGAQ